MPPKEIFGFRLPIIDGFWHKAIGPNTPVVVLLEMMVQQTLDKAQLVGELWRP